MFTGIAETLGTIIAIRKSSLALQLTIKPLSLLDDLKRGDSIAVNGICLTITQLHNASFSADVMPETIKKTTLKDLQAGSTVNLERALLPTTRLGGHIVSGHIDGTGTLTARKKDGNALLLWITAASAILKYIIPQGSVTLDGISLTVIEVNLGDFSVSLIPHTAENTTLGQKALGSSLNIETDPVGKYVEKLLNFTPQAPVPTIDYNFLEKNGF